MANLSASVNSHSSVQLVKDFPKTKTCWKGVKGNKLSVYIFEQTFITLD